MFRSPKYLLAGIAALVALGLGAAAIAGAATSSNTGASTTPQPPSGAHPPPGFHGPAPGTSAHENAEKPVTGDAAARAQAAAVKSAGSGTAGPVTTDEPGTGYETTVTKADGTKVQVHLDSSYKVTRGPCSGGCPPPGANAGHGGPPLGANGTPPGADGGSSSG